MLDGLRRLLPTRSEQRLHEADLALADQSAPDRTFRLPDLGEGLADAEMLEWKVAVGDTVEHDQVVAEVETAKSVVTLPSPFAGTVTALHCPVGEVVRVGAPLITVAEPAPVDGSGAVLTGYGTGASQRWSRTAPEAAGDSTLAKPDTHPRSDTRIPLDASAAKFVRGHRDTPAVTIWADTDATGLLAARDSGGTGLLPLLARVCLAGLVAFPELNARVDADREEIVRPPHVHLGIAAQTAHGLVVPVVRDADRLPPGDLAAELRRLTALARRGPLPVEHRTGGTFTLNNYGVFGVDGATPILNHPQAAMLGVGRITDRPWAVDGGLEVRKVVQVSLTFDHRVCDGGTAAGFLRHVVDGITAPDGPARRPGV
ncbi:dihydrolipoamide acetyltransferase family protein [Streptomyces sp. NPDC050619]|uniref:dihydrolipoamide acetyltransferase family protein n=1 Tax=Streptomyces sp. NPDC050619 TaxID=3157214 RepID=UPI00343421B7